MIGQIGTMGRAAVLDRLRRALDPVTVSDALNREWPWARQRGWTVASVVVHRVFPRGDDEFVVKYQLGLKGEDAPQEMVAFGQLIGGDLTDLRTKVLEKLRKSRRKQIDREDDGQMVAIISDLRVLLRVPGFDEKLPGLMLLHHRRKADAFVRRFIDPAPAKENARPRVKILNHRLGKRCVLGAEYPVRGKRPGVVLRCLRQRGARFRHNQDVMRRLWTLGFDREAADGIRIPEALGYDENLATEVIEAMPGTVLEGAPQWPLADQAFIAGRVLGKLHACPLPVARHHQWPDELVILDDWVSLTALLRPELEPALTRARRWVGERLAAEATATRCLAHRDFYGKQLIHDGERTALIDFDTLCQADPALDIGNYLAHQRLLAVAEGADGNHATRFFEGYEAYRSLPPLSSIGAWYDAALLRLACLYALHTGWATVSSTLLDALGEEMP